MIHDKKIWIRTFYRSLMPKGGGEPPAVLKQIYDVSFSAFDACKRTWQLRQWPGSAAAGSGREVMENF
jgi:hypothetical protein